MIYLDNAATTSTKPDTVIQAVNRSLTELSVNAGRGSYALARQAVCTIDNCRDKILHLGKIKTGYHAYFTPSATIALNQIILGLSMDRYTNIYVSPFEHNAVMRPLFSICAKNDSSLIEIPFIEGTWTCDWKKLEEEFATRTPDYVFVSMVSNTTGLILPVKEITSIAHANGARVIVDCAQAYGAIDVDYSDVDADAYIFAGHKTLLGPFGIAGFILKDGWEITSGLTGGTGSDSLNLNMPSASDGGYEPGSLNIPAICGLSAACDWIEAFGISNIQTHEQNLVSHFVSQVCDNDKICLYYPPRDKASNIVSFNIRGYQSHEVGEILDEEFNIAVRTGYQCAPWVHRWLHSNAYGGIVRCSVSYFNTMDDIDCLLRAIETL